MDLAADALPRHGGRRRVVGAASTRGFRGAEQRWVTVSERSAIDEIDSDVARRIFGSSAAVALGGWPGATTGRAWASSAGFAEDVATGAIAEDVRVVMYDPEHWDATPAQERLDPRGSIEAFCTLARTRGYTVVVTPIRTSSRSQGAPTLPGLVRRASRRTCVRASWRSRRRAPTRSRRRRRRSNATRPRTARSWARPLGSRVTSIRTSRCCRDCRRTPGTRRRSRCCSTRGHRFETWSTVITSRSPGCASRRSQPPSSRRRSETRLITDEFGPSEVSGYGDRERG